MFEESVTNYGLGGKLIVPGNLGVVRHCDKKMVQAVDEYCHFGPSGIEDEPDLLPIDSTLSERPVLVVQDVPYGRAYLKDRFPHRLQRVTGKLVHVALLPHSEYDPIKFSSQCVLANTKDQMPREGYTFLLKRNKENLVVYLEVIQSKLSQFEHFLGEEAYCFLNAQFQILKAAIEGNGNVFKAMNQFKRHIQVLSSLKTEHHGWLELLKSLVTELYFSVPENERALIRYGRGTWAFFKDEEFIHGRIPMGFDAVGGDLSYFSFKKPKPA